MKHSTFIRTGRHCVLDLHVHLVFVTKYRRNIFNKAMLDFLKTTFNDTCESFDAKLVEFKGETDHVYLVVHYHPKIAISRLVNSLKGVSSRLLRTKFKPQVGKYYWKGMLWSPSYFAGSCGGAPITVIQKYIEQQNAPRF